MTDALLLSNILLWICLVLLLIVVLALVRQIGILYERIAPAGALMINQTLEVGQDAPIVSAKDENSLATIDIGGVNKQGQSQLIFFISPDCPVCKTLLPAFRSASLAEAQWLKCALASDAPSSELKPLIEQERLSKFIFLNSSQLGRQYGVSKLPYAVLIDAAGKIASMGLVNSREHFDSLFNAKESNVASLQDYLQKN